MAGDSDQTECRENLVRAWALSSTYPVTLEEPLPRAAQGAPSSRWVAGESSPALERQPDAAATADCRLGVRAESLQWRRVPLRTEVPLRRLRAQTTAGRTPARCGAGPFGPGVLRGVRLRKRGQDGARDAGRRQEHILSPVSGVWWWPADTIC